MMAYTADEVRELVIAQAKKAGNGTQLAKRWRCSREYVLSVMAGHEGPGPKILRPLGLKRVVLYVG
jgi:hypothetical protein